ncbi:hypothetical protein Cgig2_021660 [Carnegiea gigantea]|uniref:Uncharacterized protein n=1 Tax=Carnegiea gigantea TaxID=171969 RepID=A0A9Q1QEQ3_9CARY|nr:hypothetical protein Cgig2_021660 [Carnegiea gigantea]
MGSARLLIEVKLDVVLPDGVDFVTKKGVSGRWWYMTGGQPKWFNKDCQTKYQKDRDGSFQTLIGFWNVLGLKQQAALCRASNATDVRNAMFNIPNTKSPGINGFSHSWDQVRELVINAVLNLFKTGKPLKYVSHINLVLIRKVFCPNEADNFRPLILLVADL